MQCLKKKRDGSRCGAHALADEKYCSLHSEPGKAAVLGRKGGRRRTVHSPEDLQEFPAPKSAADLLDLLAHSIVEVRSGKLEPRLANSISYLGTGFLRAIEVANLERRLEDLERERGKNAGQEGGSSCTRPGPCGSTNEWHQIVNRLTGDH